VRSRDDWHDLAAPETRLPADAARQLREIGFIVIPGPVIPGGCKRLAAAYDRAVATADPADVHIGKSGSSIRVNDFVNRGPEFDGIYVYPPLLAACSQVIGRPFKLSGMRARTSAECARGRSIQAHQPNGSMWTSNIGPTAGRWSAAS
jgi:hypothetical protein